MNIAEFNAKYGKALEKGIENGDEFAIAIAGNTDFLVEDGVEIFAAFLQALEIGTLRDLAGEADLKELEK